MPISNHPQIAVIIPTYNRADTLKKCIDSVNNQTVQLNEIIVIDDSSTDNTQSVLKSYDNITVSKTTKNSGAQVARNIGIKAAKSEWIAFLDSDDEWLPDKIEKQLSILKSVNHNPFTLVHGDCIVRDKQGNMKNWHLNNIEGNDVYRQLLSESGTFFPAILTSKTALAKIGFLAEDIQAYQEWDTAIKLAKICSFYHIQEPLFIYNIKDDSISNNFDNDVKGYFQIVKKYESEIKNVCGQGIFDNHILKCANMAINSNNFEYSRELLSKIEKNNFKKIIALLLSYLHIKPKYIHQSVKYMSWKN